MRLSDIISVNELDARIGTSRCPIIVDVRRPPVFAEAADVLPAARRADHLTLNAAELGAAPYGVVLYCIHGHNVSQLAAARMRAQGIEAAQLAGGIEAWRAAGLPLIARAPDTAQRFGHGSTWVTRRRPKIDRVACPWLVRRFIDDRARFLYVEDEYVQPIAGEIDGIAFDARGAAIGHQGERCSFDALLDRYAIDDQVLRALATIIRGADTNRLDLAPEAPGLLAITYGAAASETDDHALLDRLFPVYDALYARLKSAHRPAAQSAA